MNILIYLIAAAVIIIVVLILALISGLIFPRRQRSKRDAAKFRADNAHTVRSIE